MTDHAIMLVGGPDSGKTNFVARLWAALGSRSGALVAPAVPDEIRFVEDALSYLLQGDFAPRSNKDIEDSLHTFSVPVVKAGEPTAEPIQIIVPDVTGELWKNAVETCELPQRWMDDLRTACGALLFVRIGSDQIIEPLDWVNAAQFLSMTGSPLEDGEDDAGLIPTQVALCELLRFMEHSLGAEVTNIRPRVAIMVTAWDWLDPERAERGPMAYLAEEYPMFAGRLRDVSKLDIEVFGVSVVGGDFVDPAFKTRFLEAELDAAGYVVQEVDGAVQKTNDLTLPVAWVVEGPHFGA